MTRITTQDLITALWPVLPLLAFLATVVAIALVQWGAQPHRERHVAAPPLDLFAHPFAQGGHTMDRPDLKALRLAGGRFAVSGVTPAGVLFITEGGARVLDVEWGRVALRQDSGRGTGAHGPRRRAVVVEAGGGPMSAGKVRRRRWVHQGVKREAWGFTLTTPEGRVRKSGYLTRGEAQEALDALKRPAPVAEPAVPAASTLTFKAALDRYHMLRARKKSIREDRRIGGVLLARFGNVPLAEITAAKISAYKAERLAVTSSRLGAPLSVASINRPLAMLRSVLRVACREWEALPAVPHIKLEKEPQGRLRWLDEPEAARLLAACRPHRDLADLVEFALFTGMRQGELLGLTWARVDRARGVVLLEVTKSGRRREVPLNAAADAVLARRQGAGTTMFPPRWDGYRRAWRKAVEAAKLDEFRFHDLRHTFASWAMQRGATLPALQALLGHATLTMTMRYAHLAPEHLRDAVALLDGAMAPPARAQRDADLGTTDGIEAEVSRKS